MKRLFLCLSVFFFFPSLSLYAFEGRVHKVVDGDTVILEGGVVCRYLGINSPEKGEPFWREAKVFNEQLVKGERVRLVKEGPLDKYGRLLVYLYRDELFVNGEILRAGMAHLFCLEPLKLYRLLFSLQEEARRRKVGIWGKGGFEGPLKITSLHADAPGDDRQNLNGEYLRICNISPRAVELRGFQVRDRQGHCYTFREGRLAPGFTAVLHSGRGEDRVTGHQLVFYWGSPYPIWNNKGDTAYLLDPRGRLIHSFVYRRSP